MIEEIQKALEPYGGKWKEKKGIWEFETVIAERKAFLSSKKLTYAAKIRIDDEKKIVKFTEMLKENSSGFSSGGIDDGMSSGFGFKAGTYNTTSGALEGSIKEQSDLFGKDFSYKFDYQEVRTKVEEMAKAAGYEFAYQVTPIGL